MTSSISPLQTSQEKAADDLSLPSVRSMISANGDQGPSTRFWWNISRTFRGSDAHALQRALIKAISVDDIIYERLRVSFIALDRWSYQILFYGKTRDKLNGPSEHSSPYSSPLERRWEPSDTVCCRVCRMLSSPLRHQAEVCYKFGLLREDSGLRMTRISGKKELYHNYIECLFSRIEELIEI